MMRGEWDDSADASALPRGLVLRFTFSGSSVPRPRPRGGLATDHADAVRGEAEVQHSGVLACELHDGGHLLVAQPHRAQVEVAREGPGAGLRSCARAHT